MDNPTPAEVKPVSEEVLPPANPVDQADQAQKRNVLIIVIIAAVVILAGLVVGVIALVKAPAETTGQVRDIFIIFMAMEFLVIGVALVILMVQLTTLINLLQNEIKPIIQSTNETVSTLRGTATFLSDNLSEPVIKMNEVAAGMKKILEFLKFIK
jgi:NADH:ubiquinone oxidoreductase subunit K